MRIPPGEVTVLLGSEPDRRRLLQMLVDPCHDGLGDGPRRVRRVAASPALPVDKRVALLIAATRVGGDLVLVSRATDGLDSHARRTVLDHLRCAARQGAAVAVDDADPIAALAVADRAMRTRTGAGRPLLETLDRWPIPDLARS